MARTFEGSTAAQSVIPAEYWNARLAGEGVDGDADVTGAVLLRLTAGSRTDAAYTGRSREVAAAATEEAPKLLRRLLTDLRGEPLVPLVIGLNAIRAHTDATASAAAQDEVRLVSFPLAKRKPAPRRSVRKV